MCCWQFGLIKESRSQRLKQISTDIHIGLDTNIPNNALKIYPEILNFFPKNPSKNL